MKKVMALITACIFFLTVFSIVKASDTPEELILNGGFETLDTGGKPENWTLAAGTWGLNVESSGVTKVGVRSVRMYGDSANVMLYQTVCLIPGEVYNFSTWVLDAVGKGALIKFEFGDGVSLYGTDDIYISASSAQNKGIWTNITRTFTAPSRAVIVNIYCRLSGGGNVTFDEVSLLGKRNSKYMPEFSAPAEGENERLLNGDFQTVTGNSANSWKASGWGSTVSVSTAKVHTNPYSLKVQSTGASVYFRQDVNNITPLATYQISAWVNADANCANKITFRLYYSLTNDSNFSEGNLSRASSFTDYFSPDANVWTRVVFQFKMPANTRSISLRPTLTGTGTMYIDDVSFFMVEKPSAITLTTDKVFYYPDAKTGKGEAIINTDVFLQSGYVEFSLKKNDNVLDYKRVDVLDNKAEFDYNIAAITELQEEYTVEATLKNLAGTALCTERQPIYKYERPGYLGADGVFRKNGERIHPVIMYHVDTTDYATVKQAGVNVVQGYFKSDTVENSMNLAQSNGLKVLFPLYRNMKPAGYPDNIEYTKMMVEKLKTHPALFGWMVMDEPFGISPNQDDYLRESYKIIRDIDPNHPVYLLEAPIVPEYYNQTQKYCDVFAIDPYPCDGLYGEYTDFVAQNVKLAKEAVYYEKPVYTIVQVYKHGTTPLPTPDQVRNMLYQAFWGGSAGVGFYTFEESEGQKDLDDTAIWPAIHDFEYKEMFNAFVEKKYVVITQESNEEFSYKVWKNGGDIFIAARNKTKESEEISVRINDLYNKYATEALGGSTSDVLISGDNVKIALLGEKACLYILSDSTKRPVFEAHFEGDFSGFSAGAVTKIALDGGRQDGVSLKVDGTDASSGLPFAHTFMKLPKPGGIYKLKFWAKNDGTIPPYIQINATQSESINWGTAIPTYSWSPEVLMSPNKDVWTYYEFMYKLSDNTDYIELMLRTAGGKTTCYDDVTLEILKGEVSFLCDGETTDRIKTGTLTAVFKEGYSTEIDADVMIVMGIYDEIGGNRTMKDVAIKRMTGREFDESGGVISTDVKVETVTANTMAIAFVWSSSLKPYIARQEIYSQPS